ncbi:hypothetical protein HanRHA438_Chr12g0568431 [Helianthus annuus]|nr:hypothetical protein HanRHA438_Chr12g0568431 [Helianthus annuus]
MLCHISFISTQTNNFTTTQTTHVNTAIPIWVGHPNTLTKKKKEKKKKKHNPNQH